MAEAKSRTRMQTGSMPTGTTATAVAEVVRAVMELLVLLKMEMRYTRVALSLPALPSCAVTKLLEVLEKAEMSILVTGPRAPRTINSPLRKTSTKSERNLQRTSPHILERASKRSGDFVELIQEAGGIRLNKHFMPDTRDTGTSKRLTDLMGQASLVPSMRRRTMRRLPNDMKKTEVEGNVEIQQQQLIYFETH